VFLIQLVGVAIVAVVVAVPSVLLIPRQRKSPLFDRVLWGGTWFLAILGAFAAPSYFGDMASLNSFVIAEMPVIPTLIGAAVGALSINVLLWLMDRFSPITQEDDLTENKDEEDDVTRSDNSNKPHG
jgi:hypothetical protein